MSHGGGCAAVGERSVHPDRIDPPLQQGRPRRRRAALGTVAFDGCAVEENAAAGAGGGLLLPLPPPRMSCGSPIPPSPATLPTAAAASAFSMAGLYLRGDALRGERGAQLGRRARAVAAGATTSAVLGDGWWAPLNPAYVAAGSLKVDATVRFERNGASRGGAVFLDAAAVDADAVAALGAACGINNTASWYGPCAATAPASLRWEADLAALVGVNVSAAAAGSPLALPSGHALPGIARLYDAAGLAVSMPSVRLTVSLAAATSAAALGARRYSTWWRQANSAPLASRPYRSSLTPPAATCGSHWS